MHARRVGDRLLAAVPQTAHRPRLPDRLARDGPDADAGVPIAVSLTLTGKVDLAGNSTTFTGLPDIPLTDLNVTLDGGAHGLFKVNCATPSGTATAS